MNKFQLDILKQLIDYTSPVSAGDISVSIRKGPSEVVVELKLISRDISVWVYEDGAQVRGRKLDIRYEAESFSDITVLAATFLARAKEIAS